MPYAMCMIGVNPYPDTMGTRSSRYPARTVKRTVTLTQVCDVEWQHPVATAHGSVVECTVGVKCGIRSLRLTVQWLDAQECRASYVPKSKTADRETCRL
jgi:hypothetical protein